MIKRWEDMTDEERNAEAIRSKALIERLEGEGLIIMIPTSPNYGKNYDRHQGSSYPCVICGKACPNPKQGVHMWWGSHAVKPSGARILREDEGDGGDMGFYPLGSDCLRRHPEMLPFVIKDDQGIE